MNSMEDAITKARFKLWGLLMQRESALKTKRPYDVERLDMEIHETTITIQGLHEKEEAQKEQDLFVAIENLSKKFDELERDDWEFSMRLTEIYMQGFSKWRDSLGRTEKAKIVSEFIGD